MLEQFEEAEVLSKQIDLVFKIKIIKKPYWKKLLIVPSVFLGHYKNARKQLSVLHSLFLAYTFSKLFLNYNDDSL
jgi:hypothetical protein